MKLRRRSSEGDCLVVLVVLVFPRAGACGDYSVDWIFAVSLIGTFAAMTAFGFRSQQHLTLRHRARYWHRGR